MAFLKTIGPQSSGRKYAELDFSPFTTQTTVENAVERLTVLQDRLCGKPLNPYALAEIFGFSLGDRKLPDPLLVQPVYPCARMMIIDKGLKVNQDYGFWRGLEGQYISYSYKFGFEMHPWDKSTLKQVASEIPESNRGRLLTSCYWNASDKPERTDGVLIDVGKKLEGGLLPNPDDISAYFGVHVSFIGLGRWKEPNVLVCGNPLQTQTLSTASPFGDEEGRVSLRQLMLGVLDRQIGFTKHNAGMEDERAHWINQRRLLREGHANIFHPLDKQWSALPLLHYTCHVLGVSDLGYYQYGDRSREAGMYERYVETSKQAVSSQSGGLGPKRIVRYTKEMDITEA